MGRDARDRAEVVHHSKLASLGDFATLRAMIGCWYHQDALLDVDTKEEIWRSIWRGGNEGENRLLIIQLAELIGRGDDEVLGVWNAEADSHHYTDAKEAREFLESMLAVLLAQR